MITRTLDRTDLNAMAWSPWLPTQRSSGSFVFKSDAALQRHNDWISTVTHIFVLYTRWSEDIPAGEKHRVDMEITALVRDLMNRVPVEQRNAPFYVNLSSAIHPWYRNLTQ